MIVNNRELFLVHNGSCPIAPNQCLAEPRIVSEFYISRSSIPINVGYIRALAKAEEHHRKEISVLPPDDKRLCYVVGTPYTQQSSRIESMIENGELMTFEQWKAYRKQATQQSAARP